MAHRDNSAFLATWRTERAEKAHARVRQVLDRLAANGAAVTFMGVAAEAKVSRSWLYESSFAGEIRAARVNTPLQHQRSRQEPASVSSLKTRLADALDDNRRLRDELAEANRQLALALGASRGKALRG